MQCFDFLEIGPSIQGLTSSMKMKMSWGKDLVCLMAGRSAYNSLGKYPRGLVAMLVCEGRPKTPDPHATQVLMCKSIGRS